MRSLVLVARKAVVAAGLHDAADVLLAPALRAAVDGGGVDVVDAEVEGALDDGDGDVEVRGLLECSLAAEGKDADLVARLAEVACGHGGAGVGVNRQRWQGARCFGDGALGE